MGRICYINGIPYLVTLPTGGHTKKDHNNQWDHLIDCLDLPADDLDRIIHWKGLFSMCNEKDSYLRCCTIRGYSTARNWQYFSYNHTDEYVGFRPVFVPLNPTTLRPDSSILKELSNGQCVSFGSFSLGQKIVKPPQNVTAEGDIPDYEPEADLSFGSLKSGYGFHVIKVDGWLITDRVLIKNISWKDLKNLGYAD